MAKDKKPETLPDPEHELNPDVYRVPDAEVPEGPATPAKEDVKEDAPPDKG